MKISLCIAVWNTSHLLRRSIYTYLDQYLDPDDWELIVIDDNSDDDVQEAISPADGELNMQYIRLEHSYGMRGNTVSFNTAFAAARAPIIAESTPEILLPPDTLKLLLEPHEKHERCFVAMKTYNLVPEMQLLIDSQDWRGDVMNISRIPGWDDPYVQNNVKTVHFGTHQTCSIRKEVFYEITDGKGFPLFGDYGSDDPWYSGRRQSHNITDITLPNEHMAVHQWHPPWQYWAAKGRAPNTNKWGHSMSNYMGDKSGHVPEGGTCEIWDRGSHEQASEEEKTFWYSLDGKVLRSGVSRSIVQKEE